MKTKFSNKDQRLLDIIKILECIDFNKSHNVLSIGIVEGTLENILAKKVSKLTGIGINIDNYIERLAKYKKLNSNIELLEMDVMDMKFDDSSFDFVLASHVFEYCLDLGIIIDKIKNVLNKDGTLLVFVPPHEYLVVAGHLNVGWSVGQLMYLLAVKGFDVVNGKFMEYGYNVFAAVKKSNLKLPKLKFDKGDIKLLKQSNVLPESIFDKYNEDGFSGFINQYNFENNQFKRKPIIFNIIFNIAFALFPKKVRKKIRMKLAYFLVSLGKKLIYFKNY